MLTVLTILASSRWRVFLLQFGCWGSIRDRDRGRLDTGGRGSFKALVNQHLLRLCLNNSTNFH